MNKWDLQIIEIGRFVHKFVVIVFVCNMIDMVNIWIEDICTKSSRSLFFVECRNDNSFKSSDYCP